MDGPKTTTPMLRNFISGDLFSVKKCKEGLMFSQVDKTAFVHIADIRKTLGVSRMTMWNRLVKSGIPTYTDPFDRRRRMIKAHDVPQLAGPIETPTPRET